MTFGASARCVGPAVVLAVLPKCPACLAAYLAAASGAGVSLTTAARTRAVLLVLCCGLLLFALGREVTGRARRKRQCDCRQSLS